MRSAVVYQITNRINGKIYIGLTRFDIDKRWAEHRYSARSGRRTRLYSAIRKYGEEHFDLCEIASCLDDPSEVERAVIQSLRPEYNQTNGGEFTRGRKHSREVIERIAAGNRGKTRTPEQRAANSAQARARHASDPEYRAQAIAALHRARPLIDQEKRIAAASKALRERVWTDESRAKLSASCMGRRYSPEIIAKVAEKKRKPVECIETGEVFESCLHAKTVLGISNGNIGRVCDGQRKRAGGLTFRWI